MDTVTGVRVGSALFVYFIREWLLRYDSPRNLTILPWCTMRSMTAAVLLQCLFDRFGSVFPQCGLMVFPGVVIVSR